ncbi:gamma-glutamylcyclotransferase-like [Aphidius gifuensis]|nr:gamma-glutamylcyclotransferase-like [Aphidius gifuensis]
MSNKFLYFAYGSNLLDKRIHINNPTAQRQDIGRIENFRLDFMRFSNRWKGASATIVPTPGAHVWGAIWEIGIENLKDLDQQEGVNDGLYFPLDVDVANLVGKKYRCRVYQQCNNPKENIDLSHLPKERQPSLVYLSTMIKGAEQSNIPSDYINKLKLIKHNNYFGQVDIGLELNDINTE